MIYKFRFLTELHIFLKIARYSGVILTFEDNNFMFGNIRFQTNFLPANKALNTQITTLVIIQFTMHFLPKYPFKAAILA